MPIQRKEEKKKRKANSVEMKYNAWRLLILYFKNQIKLCWLTKKDYKPQNNKMKDIYAITKILHSTLIYQICNPFLSVRLFLEKFLSSLLHKLNYDDSIIHTTFLIFVISDLLKDGVKIQSTRYIFIFSMQISYHVILRTIVIY